MSSLVRFSLAINRMTGGPRGEMFCARAHRRGWRRLERVIDAVFLRLRGERGHCRSIWAWHYDD